MQLRQTMAQQSTRPLKARFNLQRLHKSVIKLQKQILGMCVLCHGAAQCHAAVLPVRVCPSQRWVTFTGPRSTVRAHSESWFRKVPSGFQWCYMDCVIRETVVMSEREKRGVYGVYLLPVRESLRKHENNKINQNKISSTMQTKNASKIKENKQILIFHEYDTLWCLKTF